MSWCKAYTQSQKTEKDNGGSEEIAMEICKWYDSCSAVHVDFVSTKWFPTM